MIICGTPNIICGLVMLFFIPESPKFMFYQGNDEISLNILKKMYKLNMEKSEESFNVKTFKIEHENEAQADRTSINLLEFMWSQTAPLFKHPHLKNTLTACFIQFCIFNTSNGFWTFFPEITNRISLWKNDPSHVSATVCQILDDTRINLHPNQTLTDSFSCVTKLELSTYANAIILISLYIVGYIVIAFIINKTGKLVIISFFLFGSAVSSIMLMVVDVPSTLTYIYISMLTVGIAFNVVNASTVELYPTNLRAMAICISLMIGRLGCVVGSNVIGLMLDQFCQYTFLMPTILLIISGCLAFTIPNISKRIV
jgi:MFS transporter, VNT family, synaptic vesicle glycoprotein 2